MVDEMTNFKFLKEAKGNSEATVDESAKAIKRFEIFTGFRDFKAFHIEQAVAFKKDLAQQMGRSSGERLSKATLYRTGAHLRRFFLWIADQRGYKSRIARSDADYFNLSEKDCRIARATRAKRVPTVEQVLHAIRSMPTSNEIELRNRAVVAFILLTGARDSAVASMKLKHIDLDSRSVYQDAREVDTKFSKSFWTAFFPVGAEVEKIVVEWVTYLRTQKLWSNEDPIFPKTRVGLGKSHEFELFGLMREHWKSTDSIRKIFRDSFERCGLPYFNPHSVRDTLVQLGLARCRTAEEFKAWSQNIGHDGVLVSFTSYGELTNQRRAEIMERLSFEDGGSRLDNKTLESLLVQLRNAADQI